MSWESRELGVVGFQGDRWSTADAAWLLGVEERDVRDAIRREGVEAVGKRKSLWGGTRHVRVFLADDILRVLGMGVEKFFWRADLGLRGYFLVLRWRKGVWCYVMAY